jgi:hypothetical protein
MNNRTYNFEELDNINTTYIVSIDIDKYNINSDEFIDKLIKYTNIRELILKTEIEEEAEDDYDYSAILLLKLNNKIALLHNLSEIEIEYLDSRFCSCELTTGSEVSFIYNDCLTVVYSKLLNNIPIHIKHVNILNIYKGNVHLLNSLPENIETIHISCANPNCLGEITNLPTGVKNINMTFSPNYLNLKISDKDIKIPFSCELLIDYASCYY